MSVNPPVITDEGSNPPQTSPTDDFFSIVFDTKNEGFKTEISDTTVISSPAPLKQAEVTVDSKKGETVELKVATERTQGSTFQVEGQGGLDMEINGGVFKRNTINGKGGDDSIKFGGEVKVGKGAKINLNRGKDTVTFGKDAEIRGINNVIDVGDDRASDEIKFRNLETNTQNINEDSPLIIKNFGSNDKIIVGTGNDKKIYSKDLGNLESDTFDNIVIKFQDEA